LLTKITLLLLIEVDKVYYIFGEIQGEKNRRKQIGQFGTCLTIGAFRMKGFYEPPKTDKYE